MKKLLLSSITIVFIVSISMITTLAVQPTEDINSFLPSTNINITVDIPYKDDKLFQSITNYNNSKSSYITVIPEFAKGATSGISETTYNTKGYYEIYAYIIKKSDIDINSISNDSVNAHIYGWVVQMLRSTDIIAVRLKGYKNGSYEILNVTNGTFNTTPYRWSFILSPMSNQDLKSNSVTGYWYTDKVNIRLNPIPKPPPPVEPPPPPNLDFVPWYPDNELGFLETHIKNSVGNAVNIGLIILAMIVGIYVLIRIVKQFSNTSSR